MKSRTFNKTRLATSLSLILGAVAAMPAVAQESEEKELTAGDFEVIEVSGIRESLTKAMLTKKAASGVVGNASAYIVFLNALTFIICKYDPVQYFL